MEAKTKARGATPAKRPDWWPLPYYSRPLNEREWIGALAFRLAVQAQWRNAQDAADSADVFRSLIVDETRSLEEIGTEFEGQEGLGVRGLSIFEAHLLSLLNQSTEPDEASELASSAAAFARGGGVSTPEFFERVKKALDAKLTPAADALGARGFLDVLSGWIPCSVDLRLDDDTLMESFELWLALQRSTERAKHTQSPITAKVCEKWHRLRLLPAFDMLLWADICGQAPTDAFMGRLLWPDESMENAIELVDTTERYRKLTKPAIRTVFHWGTVEQLVRQLDAERIFQRLLRLHHEVAGTKRSEKRSGKAVRLRSTGRELIPASPSTRKKR